MPPHHRPATPPRLSHLATMSALDVYRAARLERSLVILCAYTPSPPPPSLDTSPEAGGTIPHSPSTASFPARWASVPSLARRLIDADAALLLLAAGPQRVADADAAAAGLLGTRALRQRVLVVGDTDGALRSALDAERVLPPAASPSASVGDGGRCGGGGGGPGPTTGSTVGGGMSTGRRWWHQLLGGMDCTSGSASGPPGGVTGQCWGNDGDGDGGPHMRAPRVALVTRDGRVVGRWGGYGCPDWAVYPDAIITTTEMMLGPRPPSVPARPRRSSSAAPGSGGGGGGTRGGWAEEPTWDAPPPAVAGPHDGDVRGDTLRALLRVMRNDYLHQLPADAVKGGRKGASSASSVLVKTTSAGVAGAVTKDRRRRRPPGRLVSTSTADVDAGCVWADEPDGYPPTGRRVSRDTPARRRSSPPSARRASEAAMSARPQRRVPRPVPAAPVPVGSFVRPFPAWGQAGDNQVYANRREDSCRESAVGAVQSVADVRTSSPALSASMLTPPPSVDGADAWEARRKRPPRITSAAGATRGSPVGRGRSVAWADGGRGCDGGGGRPLATIGGEGVGNGGNGNRRGSSVRRSGSPPPLRANPPHPWKTVKSMPALISSGATLDAALPAVGGRGDQAVPLGRPPIPSSRYDTSGWSVLPDSPPSTGSSSGGGGGGRRSRDDPRRRRQPLRDLVEPTPAEGRKPPRPPSHSQLLVVSNGLPSPVTAATAVATQRWTTTSGASTSVATGAASNTFHSGSPPFPHCSAARYNNIPGRAACGATRHSLDPGAAARRSLDPGTAGHVHDDGRGERTRRRTSIGALVSGVAGIGSWLF